MSADLIEQAVSEADSMEAAVENLENLPDSETTLLAGHSLPQDGLTQKDVRAYEVDNYLVTIEANRIGGKVTDYSISALTYSE